MQIERIELGKLVDHPDNCNVMDERLLGKLTGLIGSSGRYEPLVVRVHPERAGCYELINGHHRRKVLAALGVEVADCVVWEGMMMRRGCYLRRLIVLVGGMIWGLGRGCWRHCG